MEFDYTEEQKIFRRTIRDFAEKEVAPLVDDAEKNEKFPRELLPKLGELGYLGVVYPIEYGGAGAGKVEECIFVEELGRVCVGITGGVMIQSGMATSSIFDYGSDYLKQEYLVPAIKGNKIAAFALSEPNAGSDVASIECRAVEDGDSYVIGGNKTYISNGPIADFVLTAAYTDKSKGSNGGISLFVVDTKLPGFSARKMHKFCLRSSETGELHYDNVRVPKENLVGEVGYGFKYLMESLTGGRIIHAARSMGLASAAYDASLEYAQVRQQFGRPIGKFQAVAFKLARMATELHVGRLLVYDTARLHDQGKRCIKEAAMAKLFTSESAQSITREAMHIHGGFAFFDESPIQRYFRDASLGTTVEGTSEVQQMIISKEIGVGSSI